MEDLNTSARKWFLFKQTAKIIACIIAVSTIWIILATNTFGIHFTLPLLTLAIIVNFLVMTFLEGEFQVAVTQLLRVDLLRLLTKASITVILIYLSYILTLYIDKVVTETRLAIGRHCKPQNRRKPEHVQ